MSFFLALAFTAGAYAQDTSGIRFFTGSWQEALTRSEKENKMIFLDGYTQWCGPCKVMAKDIFPKKEVGAYYNTHFICVSMDMEKGIGRELLRKYGINQFPALLYLRPGGYKIAHETGSRDVKELVDLGKTAFAAHDSISMDEQFDKGGYKDTAFLRKYFMYVYSNQPLSVIQAALDDVVQKDGFKALYDRKYWELLGAAATGEQVGLYFSSHLPDFIKIYGEDAVYGKLSDMYLNIRRLSSYREDQIKDSTTYQQFSERVRSRHLPDPAFFENALAFYVACRDRKYDAAFVIGDQALVNGKAWQYREMALLADWLLIGYRDNRLKAVKWAEKAVALTKDKAVREECEAVLKDLRQEPSASVVPTPRVYDIQL